jgi:hypothetical protein
MEVVAKLTKEQYLGWRLALEKLNHARTTLDLANKVASNQMLQIENLQLKSAMYKHIINSKAEDIKTAEGEFMSVRKILESEIGFEIKDVVIDEVTLEVKREELPQLLGDK